MVPRRVRARRTVAVVCSLALSALADAARADDVQATLSWVRGVGAESCGDAAALRAVIARHMGRDVFVATAPLSVEAAIARDGEGWSAELFVRRADGAALGERRLRSSEPRCEALRDALAFSIVVALDGDAALRGPPRSSPSPTQASPTASPPPTAPQEAASVPAQRAIDAQPAAPCPRCQVCEACTPPPAPRPVQRARWEGSIGARGALSLGALPGVPLGVLVHGELRPAGWPRLTASLGFWPEQSAEVSVGRASITQASASLGACPFTLRRGSFEGSPCAAVTLLALTATGYGYSESHTAKGFGLTLDVGARVRWAPSFAYVELGLDASIAVLRTPLSVERIGEVFDPPWVSVRAFLGGGLHFE